MCNNLCMDAVRETDWRPADTRGTRFMLVRTSLGLTQKEIGAKVNLTARQVQSLEDDSIGVRDLDAKVKRYAMALKIDRDWLMWGGALSNGETPDPEGPGVNSVNKLSLNKRVPLTTSDRCLAAVA